MFNGVLLCLCVFNAVSSCVAYCGLLMFDALSFCVFNALGCCVFNVVSCCVFDAVCV